MKYFEFKNPYYALISADNEDLAIEEYKSIVCDIEEDDEDLVFDEIDIEYAKEKYESSEEDSNDLDMYQFEVVSSHQNTLLVDSQLV